MIRRTLLALLSFAAACGARPTVREYDGAAAFGYLERQVAFGPRIPGTPAHERTGAWLDTLLRARADTVVVQAWAHRTAGGKDLLMRNFLARFRPEATERVLFLAHWDTRPISDGPNSRAPKAPVPGANDGASGVALLLGVADALKRQPPAVGVDLLFVDGEDYGRFADSVDVLIGSTYYAAHQPAGPRPRYAVLFDLIADRDLQVYQEGNSLVGAPDVVEQIWGIATSLGYGRYFIASPKYTLIDDHLELQKAGIRAIDVVDFDYPSWHTPDDTIDKVSAQSLQVVGDVAMAILRREKP
jgi:glutaminyl-peptide cyclotransferase